MKRSIFFVTRAALVAAAYFALATLLQPVSFGPVQFRLSEALVLLPLFMPEAVVGVTVGCFLTNFIYSTPYDVLFGTVATALAALLTCLLRRHRILAALPPVILNALLVPLIWVVDGSDPGYLLNVGLILASECIVVLAIGLPLTSALETALRRAGLVTVYGVRNIPYVRLPRTSGDEDDAEPQKTRSGATDERPHAEDGGAHAL